jgi:ABC-2 type transport system permease protein
VFFYLYLDAFLKQGMQMAQYGGGSMSINQQVIRGVLQNASVVILFIMPMITMRTYSEEKRSGTIELLLTSPVKDVEIILGKFFGALGLT